jgi:hypothetical protein
MARRRRSPLPRITPAAQRYRTCRRWKRWLRRIRDDITRLAIDRYIYRDVTRIIRFNQELRRETARICADSPALRVATDRAGRTALRPSLRRACGCPGTHDPPVARLLGHGSPGSRNTNLAAPCPDFRPSEEPGISTALITYNPQRDTHETEKASRHVKPSPAEDQGVAS